MRPVPASSLPTVRAIPPVPCGGANRVMAHRLTAAGTLAQHRSHREPVCNATENHVGLFQRKNRRHIAVAITTDGRRVQVPQDNLGIVDVSLLGLIRSVEFGIERVFVLITGSRRGDGRRDRQ